jgi:mono/diheme cytochrome c family protein
MPASRTTAPLVTIVAGACLLVATGAVRATAQAPMGSDGWHIPERAAMETNPAPSSPAAMARGRSLYKAKCQRCHGVDGTGHGPEADPDHPPADLTDGRRAARNPDGVMFYKIWNGRAKPKMPAMKTDIDRADVWTIVAFVKSLRR